MYVCAPQVYITSGGQDQILFKKKDSPGIGVIDSY